MQLIKYTNTITLLHPRHPLCLTLVRHKWMKYGRTTFYSILGLYLLFLLSLTTFVLTSPNPVLSPELYNCTPFFQNRTKGIPSPSVDDKTKTVNFVSWLAVLALSSINLITFFLNGNAMLLVKVG